MLIRNMAAKRFIVIGSMCTAFAIIVTGCAGAAKQEEAVVVVSGDETGTIYTLEEVKKGEVVLSKSLTCVYVQEQEQEAAFSEGGKLIEKVHVQEGDFVKKGDLLAEVSVGTLEEDIAALEYRIAKNELQLGYLDTYEEFDLTSSYYTLAYHSACENDDVDDWEERNEDIQKSYTYQREDYQDELEFDRAKLNELRQEFENSRLYAEMDGTVYSVQSKLEGTTSVRDEVIMTIIDTSAGMFEMEEPEYAKYFQENERVKLEITYSSSAGEYEVMPYKKDTWGEKQYFNIYDGPDNEGIEVDTKGSIQMVLDRKEDVLYLPNECIYKADNKFYVYVLDEQNMQTACWVEIGLVGDTDTEIVSGLNEGDMVVKR